MKSRRPRRARAPDQALELARAEARTLSHQLRQARADRHRLGIADQNRALVWAALTALSACSSASASGSSQARKFSEMLHKKKGR